MAPMLQQPYLWSLPTPRTSARGPGEVPGACTQPELPTPGPRHSCNHPLGHGDPQGTAKSRGPRRGPDHVAEDSGMSAVPGSICGCPDGFAWSQGHRSVLVMLLPLFGDPGESPAKPPSLTPFLQCGCSPSSPVWTCWPAVHLVPGVRCL